MRGDKERRRFSHSVDTDGVGVSLHLEKPGKDNMGEEEPEILASDAVESKYAKETRKLDAGVRAAVIPEGILRRIYIDPGGTTMAACVLEGDCKEHPQTVNCGTAEYRHMASMDRMKQKRKKLLKASGLEEVTFFFGEENGHIESDGLCHRRQVNGIQDEYVAGHDQPPHPKGLDGPRHARPPDGALRPPRGDPGPP